MLTGLLLTCLLQRRTLFGTAQRHGQQLRQMLTQVQQDGETRRRQTNPSRHLRDHQRRDHKAS